MIQQGERTEFLKALLLGFGEHPKMNIDLEVAQNFNMVRVIFKPTHLPNLGGSLSVFILRYYSQEVYGSMGVDFLTLQLGDGMETLQFKTLKVPVGEKGLKALQTAMCEYYKTHKKYLYEEEISQIADFYDILNTCKSTIETTNQPYDIVLNRNAHGLMRYLESKDSTSLGILPEDVVDKAHIYGGHGAVADMEGVATSEFSFNLLLTKGGTSIGLYDKTIAIKPDNSKMITQLLGIEMQTPFKADKSIVSKCVSTELEYSYVLPYLEQLGYKGLTEDVLRNLYAGTAFKRGTTVDISVRLDSKGGWVAKSTILAKEDAKIILQAQVEANQNGVKGVTYSADLASPMQKTGGLSLLSEWSTFVNKKTNDVIKFTDTLPPSGFFKHINLYDVLQKYGQMRFYSSDVSVADSPVAFPHPNEPAREIRVTDGEQDLSIVFQKNAITKHHTAVLTFKLPYYVSKANKTFKSRIIISEEKWYTVASYFKEAFDDQ